MEQPDAQLPALQACPEVQLATPATSVHEVVLEEGVQTSHPSLVVAPCV
jgi:hypothetical protein